MHRTSFAVFSIAATTAFLAVPAATAHQEPFAYLRGAQVEARGEWELEQWTTARLGKADGRYLGLDLQTELEYGVTDRFQTSLYLNTIYHDIEDARGGSETFDDRNAFVFDGTSAELKYQISDPFRQPWGLALYFEPGYRRFSAVSGEREDAWFLESKIIVQRHFFDHRLIVAFNYTVEPEWEREPGEEWETGLEMEWALGASWALSSSWRVGVEARLDTEFAEADLDQQEFSAFFLGPNVHFARDRWYATLAVLPQIAGWRDAPGTDGLHLDDQERLELRLKLGFEF